MRKDLVVKRQVAADLWLFYGLGPEAPAVKVRLRLEYLTESRAVGLRQGHAQQTIDQPERWRPPHVLRIRACV